jgi:hypothetical protein
MKNVAASVLARLCNISKSSGAPFQQVLQQYAIERFLYRISKSTHARGVELLGPVFNFEILDATELIGVVGHKREF